MEAAAEAENTGLTLAEALTRIVPAVKEARAVRDAAAAAERAVIDNARMIGYGYDEAKKKIVGAGRSGTADDYNRSLSEARTRLKAAREALMPMENELAIAERQARQFKLAVTPDAVIDILRRKSYKIGAPTSPPAAAPGAGAAMAFPPAAPAPRVSAPATNYQGFIPLSPSQAARLRGERERDSWEQTVAESQALGQDFPGGF